MSAFLGVYRQDGAAFDERVLNGILQRLRFRGPDAQNIFVERDLAFCFSVLSETVLGVAVPTPLAADVARDALVHSLSLQVARWLPQAGLRRPRCGSAPHFP
jgi:asparagine synthetase B (glutamine-hydrolysing)